MKDNFQYTFLTFLRLLRVRVTKTSVISYLESHPDEGSMLAYSDAMNLYHIENAGVNVNPEDLDNVPTPFITYFRKNGGTFSIVKSVENGIVEWLDTQKNVWEKTGYERFRKDWSGMVLLAEADENSGEKNYFQRRRQEIFAQLPVPLGIMLLSIVLGNMIAPAIQITLTISVLISLKLAGMILTTFLLKMSISSNNDLLNKLCNTGSNVNCQSVLDSPAAMITTWLSWSDLGFIYFFGSFFSLLTSVGSPQLLNNYYTFQWIFSIINVAFGVYSLYYQSIKVKLWCTLCLGVVFVFLSEFVMINFISSYSFTDLTSGILSRLLLGFSVPVIFLLLFKNIALKARERDRLKKELLKIKSNPQIFEALMTDRKDMPEMPENMPVVVLGNPDAIHTLTMVSNPLCTPCARMHQKIEKLIRQNENIRCQITFISVVSEENQGGNFIRKLFSLPDHLQHRALDEWFSRDDKNYDAWNNKYSLYPVNTSNNVNVQDMHNKWANFAEIKSTPSLFINGKSLPDIISVDDLGYYLTHFKQEIIHP